MSQYQICPYWICESRNRPDSALHDYQLTELRVTNPSEQFATLELVFYEARGDGSFVRAEWASGRWSAPPQWQRAYRPDPSETWGPSFFLYGWFELWMSSDAMVADVSVSRISRHRETSDESHSQRSIQLINRPVPYLNRFIEGLLRIPLSPLIFPDGTKVVEVDRSPFEPRDGT